MKERIRFLFYVFSLVTTCVVIAVAVFTNLLEPSETVESAVLWQIPLVSFFCSLGGLIYPWDRCCRKREMAVRVGVHYVYINMVVLGAGFWFRWYRTDHLGSLAVMVVTIALVYVVVSVISWRRSAEDARAINERLKEYQQQGDRGPGDLPAEDAAGPEKGRRQRRETK